MARRSDLTTFEFNPAKFRELIVYIAQQCADDPTFGAVKLNKILFYADISAYRELQQPITGASYRKLSEGPAPKQLVEARESLVDAGRVTIQERPHFGLPQQRLVVERSAALDLSLFTERELELVDEVIEFFWRKSAREVSDYSLREPGWIMTDELEEIPYQAAHLSAEPLDQETELRAREVGREFLRQRGVHV